MTEQQILQSYTGEPRPPYCQSYQDLKSGLPMTKAIHDELEREYERASSDDQWEAFKDLLRACHCLHCDWTNKALNDDTWIKAYNKHLAKEHASIKRDE